MFGKTKLPKSPHYKQQELVQKKGASERQRRHDMDTATEETAETANTATTATLRVRRSTAENGSSPELDSDDEQSHATRRSSPHVGRIQIEVSEIDIDSPYFDNMSHHSKHVCTKEEKKEEWTLIERIEHTRVHSDLGKFYKSETSWDQTENSSYQMKYQ